MKNKIYFPVIYMFVITAVCSGILIGFNELVKPRIEANKSFAFEQAVLKTLPIEIESLTNIELHEIFTTQLILDPNSGAYEYNKDGKLVGYALPISGKGFWAKISGVIGIAPDNRTITGIAFYQQSETPGLGAEIEKPFFTSQFLEDQGRKIATTENPIELIPVGQDLDENQVYAITGATQTCMRLEKFMNEALADWREKK